MFLILEIYVSKNLCFGLKRIILVWAFIEANKVLEPIAVMTPGVPPVEMLRASSSSMASSWVPIRSVLTPGGQFSLALLSLLIHRMWAA